MDYFPEKEKFKLTRREARTAALVGRRVIPADLTTIFNMMNNAQLEAEKQTQTLRNKASSITSREKLSMIKGIEIQEYRAELMSEAAQILVQGCVEEVPSVPLLSLNDEVPGFRH